MKLLTIKKYLEHFLADLTEEKINKEAEDLRDVEDSLLIRDAVTALLENISSGHSKFAYRDKVNYVGLPFTVIGYFSNAETPVGVVCEGPEGNIWCLTEGELKTWSTH